MGGPGGMGGPGYSVTWLPARPVRGQGADLGLVRQNLSLGAPLWKDGGDVLLGTLGVRNSMISTDALLPDSRRPFPADLWNVNLGLTYIHRFDNGWTSGLMTSFGSASDKPFHSVHELNGTVIAFLRVPAGNERDAWMYSVMYSPAGNLNFPIPGIAYVWNPSSDLRVNIGVPFSLLWRPDEDLTVNVAYFPLTNVVARITYRALEGVHLYTGYEWLTESYFLADRAILQDRFMGFEQRVLAGIRWDVWWKLTLDLEAGYAFDRRYGEGQNQGGSLFNRVDVAPGGFLGANLRLQF